MLSVSAIEADIIQLLNAVNSRSEPVIITRDDGCNGVLISEAEWQAIQPLFPNYDYLRKD